MCVQLIYKFSKSYSNGTYTHVSICFQTFVPNIIFLGQRIAKICSFFYPLFPESNATKHENAPYKRGRQTLTLRTWVEELWHSDLENTALFLREKVKNPNCAGRVGIVGFWQIWRVQERSPQATRNCSRTTCRLERLLSHTKKIRTLLLFSYVGFGEKKGCFIEKSACGCARWCVVFAGS